MTAAAAAATATMSATVTAPTTTMTLIGNGGTFNILEDCMVALTGATMPASLDQKPLDWNASH